ncbi:CoA-transferase family III domain-containing protein [Suillus fuscotomentosus]|uniref:CoA-transferase family III domain-containing protein n=1 Tax=Suillus fuscotomentosus TaxID=1912939 RepID=A0AAD4EFI7_9AGAM|nr:CoA-transferase family III domain-containing protein [Suillus fuscotomentosus]KAG1905304.1 CoA-transferase family III domain-containing protein [Suillus fuscotomentosus]
MSLNGIKVVEFAGLAPGPFAGLVLAHNGASVIRIDRPSSTTRDLLCAGKRSIALDMKTASGLRVAKDLIAKADVLIDPFRPGVLEKLELGPEVFHTSDKREGLNDKLVYARLVGFPRNGKHSTMAGHDINYIALSGILSMLPGTMHKPTFPLNLIADFAGGGLLCANGILLAIIERGRSGRGQVVNVDMVSGSRYISSFPLLSAGSSAWAGPRGTNVLDGGAPFYDVYICSDGKWMSIGCLEPQFFAQFVDKFNEVMKSSGNQGSWSPLRSTQYIKEDWPKLRKYLEDGFRTQPRDFWTEVFHGKVLLINLPSLGTDACAVPVLSPTEAAQLHGSPYPVPHPELSRTSPSPLQDEIKILDPGKHSVDILRELGLSEEDMRQLVAEGALGKEARELVERSKSKL